MQNPHTPHSKETITKNIHATQWQLQEVEMVITELRYLLSQNPTIFDDENIHRELEVLERWNDHYHRDLVTADAFSETSLLVLANLYDHLKLTMEDMQRMETIPSGTETGELLLKISHRIGRIMVSAIPH